MLISSTIQGLDIRRATCVTIGNFDGVHAGHQSLITWAIAEAKKENLDFALITFWPHPRSVLPGDAHKPLATRESRMELLENLGVEKVLEIEFTPEFANLSARDFTRDWLAPLGLRHLAVGHDFSLGRNREGTLDILRELGLEWNFRVTRFPALRMNGIPVSSTRLRQYLENGDVNSAAAFLGRFHSVRGEVAHGFGRGSILGFPTANLENIETLLPGDGVYATFATYNNQRFQAVTNIGANPTFAGNKRSVESFLLDASLDLYDQPLALEFVARIRGERRFEPPGALAAQIEKDADAARNILSGHSGYFQADR